MIDKKGISDLRAHSARNMEQLRQSVGPLALSLMPVLMTQHADLFRFGMYYQSKSENIDGILAAGEVLSFDEIQRREIKTDAGMTFSGDSKSDIFNNVTHGADSFTDHVYARPLFGREATGAYNGVHWPDVTIKQDMWFCFEDPNQLNWNDKECIELGLTVYKSLNGHDIYVGEDIQKAICLRALEQISHIDYITRLEKYKYDAQMKLHEAEPGRYSPPKPKDDKDFSAMAAYYDGIVLGRDIAWDRFESTLGFHYRKEREAELKAAGLGLEYPGYVTVSQDILDHPEFEKIFKSVCKTIAEKVAKDGQIAIPRGVSLKGATVYKGGQQMDHQCIPPAAKPPVIP